MKASFEAYESSSPYVVGIEKGNIIYAVDILCINRETQESYIETDYFRSEIKDEAKGMFSDVF
jgi:hypothetical protein